MTTFSKRYGYNPKDNNELIIEEAPSWLRLTYVKKILDDFTYIDNDSRYPNKENRTVAIKALIEDLCIRLRKDVDKEAITDSWYCGEFLYNMVMNGDWYEFYDIIEIIGEHVKLGETFLAENSQLFEIPFAETPIQPEETEYTFQSYRKRVNQLFSETNVVWRLNQDSKLRRDAPRALQTRLDSIQEEFKDEFAPAREHYKKAIRYTIERPLDPENAIKEVISSVESICRILYPGNTTLGKVVKKMRRTEELPNHLISVIEKFYAYASDEPAVRHGGTVSSKVLLDDAEFCLHVGAALIRYLIASTGRNPDTA